MNRVSSVNSYLSISGFSLYGVDIFVDDADLVLMKMFPCKKQEKGENNVIFFKKGKVADR